MCYASQSEAIRAGGVMEGLVRSGGVMEGLIRAPSRGFSSGLLILSAHTSLLTFQILQKCTNITQKQ
ncbi:hypothetical protein PO909_013390 [Leuciscus waleckii]